ncbi:hypothetical protein L1049_021785 [Liquidambar formosana]|uniref:Uncharacterized protein n=1 Tax=Liquidambar formosana TaxID=63359 RepID=A0AAP0RBD1_LIQFO
MPISACVQLMFYRLFKYFEKQAAKAHAMQNARLFFPQYVQDTIDKYQARGNGHTLLALYRKRGFLRLQQGSIVWLVETDRPFKCALPVVHVANGKYSRFLVPTCVLWPRNLALIAFNLLLQSI